MLAWLLCASTAIAGSWLPVSGPWGSSVIQDVAAADGQVVVMVGGKLFVGDGAQFERVADFGPMAEMRHARVQPGPVVWETSWREICRWEGGERTCRDIPDCVPGAFAFRGDKAWIGGLQGQLFHWDGAAWSQIRDPLLTQTPDGHIGGLSVLGPQAELWVLGGRLLEQGDDGFIAHHSPLDTGASKGIQTPEMCAADGGYVSTGDRAWWGDADTWTPMELGRVATCASQSDGSALIGGMDGHIWSVRDGVATEVPTAGSQPVVRFAGEWAASGSKLLRFREDVAVAFRDRGPGRGLADNGPAIAAAFVDADASGSPDVVLVRGSGDVRLFNQDESGQFHDHSVGSGLEGYTWTRPLFAVCDADRDGRDDVFVVDSTGSEMRMHYFRQRPGGGFVDVTTRSGIGADPLPAKDAGDLDCVDIDGDGAVDLYLSARTGTTGLPTRNYLWHNRGWGRFVAIRGSSRGLGAGNRWGGSVVFADFRGDETPEVYLHTAWGGNRMLGRTADGRWESVSEEAGFYGAYGDGIAAAAGDLDGDGDTDLMAADKHVIHFYRNDDGRLIPVTDMRLDSATKPGWFLGPSDPRLHDIDGDGDLDFSGLAGPEGPRIWMNEGDFRFSDWTGAHGVASDGATAMATADVDGDGDLDLYVARDRAPNQLWINGRNAGASPRVPARTSRGALQRRVQWLYAEETAIRAALVGLCLIGLVAFGRRRGLIWSSILAFPLAIAFCAAELFAEDLDTALRWSVLAAFAGTIPLVGVIDMRRTRYLRATRVLHFRLEGELGAGGMGTVHVAWDGNNRRRVALKLMHAALDEAPHARERFQREAALGARLDHPNLVRVYEHGDCTVFTGDIARRTSFLAMEYVRGKTLREWLRGRGALTTGQACFLLGEVLKAVEALHEADVVHRDLKPENVLISDTGEVKVADYGLARGAGVSTLTRTGDIMGTVAYMPPEYARGSDGASPATDLYTLGVMAYELAGGRLPFLGSETLEVMFRVLNDAPPPLATIRPDLPDVVVAAIERAMHRDPAKRFLTVREFAAALQPFADKRLRSKEGASTVPSGQTTHAQAAVETALGGDE